MEAQRHMSPRSAGLASRSGARTRRDVRRPDRTDAILSATYALLTEVGYDGLTVDAVAARARSSKATIYQRWPSKRELIVDAYQRAGRGSFHLNTTGDTLTADLTALLQATRDVSGTDDARAFISMLAASQHDSTIATALRDNLAAPRATCRQIVGRAVDRGELPLGVDTDGIAERIVKVMIGQAIAHQLVLGATNDEAFAADLVENVMLPMLKEIAARHQG
jgi:AcrR family transcriptional regulator